jgi:exosortase/archaeosortase family protein
VAAAVGLLGAWHLLNGAWRTAEAAVVAVVADIGPGSVEWAGGDQIWVIGAAAPFVAVVGPWCSSIGPVLATFGLCAAFARTRSVVRAAALAAIVLVVGNLVRMVAVVMIGARSGAADLEIAHDGWATWWAVAVVLGAAAIVATAFRRAQPADVPTAAAASAVTSR